MRQWGSSVQHNGMSFFPAYVPKGTLLYHGLSVPKQVTGMEWLAFEIQHAEQHARIHAVEDDDRKEDILPQRQDTTARSPAYLPSQSFLSLKSGYLQIYQTNRPLKLLYIDGMSAAACDFGPLDTQDIVLLNFTSDKIDETKRAVLLCKLADEWGLEGFIRMETGFEIIKCNFSEGLDMVSRRRRPDRARDDSYNTMFLLEHVREVTKRYHGIDGGRVTLDYSSMISAYFYPTNLSNPDANPDPTSPPLPRLIFTDPKVIWRIKSDLGHVIKVSSPLLSTDWQGVADMIVQRYSDRLQFMASGLLPDVLRSEINMLLDLYIDYDFSKPQDPIEVCSSHYLQPVQTSTQQDILLYSAFKAVTRRICETLFAVREELVIKETDSIKDGLESTVISIELIRHLIMWLDWSIWKECGQCAYNEVCFIAMFPFGTAEDHYNPQCLNTTAINSRMGGDYWFKKTTPFIKG
jgi:hypothetical protein